jgi:oligopeptide transport system substrate-binding protein
MRPFFFIALATLFVTMSCHKISDIGVKRGEKVLRMNISREPTTLDPRKVFDPSHQALISMLFEGLTKLENDLTIVLAQADSIEISSDQLVYTIQLGNFFWSNGEPVTASDFEKTFLDLLNPQFPAPHAHLLYDVKGAQLAKKGEISLSEVAIAALDSKTLRIELERPNPSFLQILASPALVPVSRSALLTNPKWAESLEEGFVCNGPFIPALWNHHTELVVKKNPRYGGKIKPKLDAIHISMIDNETTALHMYATGHLDLLGTPFSQIPLPYLKDLKDQKSLSIHPVAASLFCGFNTTSYPFNNLFLRKAFSTAIDRKALIEHITLLNEEPGLSAIPSILKPKQKGWIEDGNEKRAREYLNQALAEMEISLQELESITLYYWPMEVNYRIAQTLQHQWLETLGIEIKIEVIEFKSLLAKVEGETYQAALFAWSADYADPLSLLERFRLPTDAKNYCRWHSAAFNALLDSSSEEVDPDKRMALLEEAEGLLMADMPIAPLFHWNFSLLIQPRVKDFSMDPLGTVRFEKISVI